MAELDGLAYVPDSQLAYTNMFDRYHAYQEVDNSQGRHLFFVLVYFVRQSLLYLTGEAPMIRYKSAFEADIVRPGRSAPVATLVKSQQQVTLFAADMTLPCSFPPTEHPPLFTLTTVISLCLDPQMYRIYSTPIAIATFALNNVLTQHYQDKIF